MIVIKPLEITDAILTSSTIAEPDTGEVAWNAATSYVLGDVVIRATTHKKYENILAGVDAGVPESTATRWVEIGSTNRWAMFDTMRNTQSIKASPVTITLSPGARVDAIGLLSLEADSVTVSMVYGVDTVYSFTQSLNRREVVDWYDYFFEEFSFIDSAVRFDLPPYATGVITVELTGAADIKVGAIVIGNQSYLGKATTGAVSEELNFSRIEREVTGESILLQRRSVPKIAVQTVADNAILNKIRDTRKALNAVPAVWSGLDDKKDNPYFDTMLLLGVYKKFEINVENTAHTNIVIEVEEI